MCPYLVSEKSLTSMIMLRDFKAMIVGPRWNMSSVYKSGKPFLLSTFHGWKFTGWFLNSRFWSWLSIVSQPQNTESGRLFLLPWFIISLFWIRHLSVLIWNCWYFRGILQVVRIEFFNSSGFFKTFIYEIVICTMKVAFSRCLVVSVISIE